MKRKNPTDTQKQRLLKANAFRCCVCKRPNIGVNFHHIDVNSSNTVDENLAVLCVEDHDAHHRPAKYHQKFRHLDLDSKEILRLKNSWESFVLEAMKPDPQLLATLSCFGTESLIHSLQLVLQWPDERIEHKKSYHLLDGGLDRLTDEVFQELKSIGPGIKLTVIDKPLPVEHCPCCGSGYSRTIKPAVVARLTDPNWKTESCCSIYINPAGASLAMHFSLGKQQLMSASLHLCRGKHLHYNAESIDERIPITRKPSVRSQATKVIKHILSEWEPAHVFIGTGNPDSPELISEIILPDIWEKRC